MNLWETPNRDLGGASHLQLLLACVKATTGPVLEIGIGHSSTPCLHSICCPGRQLVSLESDTDWLANFSPWNCDGHELAIDSEASIGAAVERGRHIERWGVVFIDDSPGGDARAAQIRLFVPVADYVVMHDVEPEGNNYEPAKRALAGLNCPNVLFYSRYHPWTLAASLYWPIPFVP